MKIDDRIEKKIKQMRKDLSEEYGFTLQEASERMRKAVGIKDKA